MTAPTGTVAIEVRHRLDDPTVPAVLALVDAARAADGVHALSEHVRLHLRYGGDEQTRNVLARSGDGTIVGYAHLDVTDEVEGASAEVVVHPDHRRRGVARALVQRMLAESPDGRLRLWAHGGHPDAAALAGALGFRRVRSLWQMRRSLDAALPAPAVPDGVEVREFRPAQDPAPWLELNAAAFAGHPEQGGWSPADLQRRLHEPWFDPRGFFVALRGERMVGFHWTKVHGDAAVHGHQAIGEVYVLGIHPDERGSGLGRALTLVGLAHLRDRGLAEAMLYVDESNTAAVRLYAGLGFSRWDTDVMYARG